MDFRYTKAAVRRCFSGQVLIKISQCWSFFLIKLQAFRHAFLLKRDFDIGAFLWNLQNLWEHLFYRTLPVAASGNILWNLSLLHMRMLDRVIAWYVLALQRLFHFIACVLFLSIFFSFFTFCGSYYLLRYWGKFALQIKQWSCP